MIDGEPADTVRCFMCDNTSEFVVEFLPDAEVFYKAGPKDVYDRRIYRVTSVVGSFSKLSKFKCVRCVKCEHTIPLWVLDGNKYIKLSYRA